MCGYLSHNPTGELASNPGMNPDWESNQGPFGSQAHTKSIEPHQPGQGLPYLTQFFPVGDPCCNMELTQIATKFAKAASLGTIYLDTSALAIVGGNAD